MDRDYLPARRDMFARPRLAALLESGLQYPLVTVVAGPGYGKTTAVAGFAAAVPRPLVWLHIGYVENDPVRFWDSLGRAVQRELPALAAELKKMSLPTRPDQHEAFMRVLRRHLAGQQVVMVVDDYQAILHGDILVFWSRLVEEDIEQLTLVLVANQKVTYRGACAVPRQLRISAEDLAYTGEEIQALFESCGRRLSAADAGRLARETDGWPLALHIMCRAGSSPGAAMADATHLQLAAELFEDHYYAALSPQMRRLLVRLSHFQRFPLDLVREIAETDAETAQTELVRNVFVNYDYSTRLFSFQSMYRDFLAYKQNLMAPEDVRAVFQSAGQCFLAQGYVLEAMDAFWRCSDFDAYLRALAAMPRTMLSPEVARRVAEHLEHLPERYARENPLVDYARAMMVLNNMEIPRAREIFLGLKARLEKEPPGGATDTLLGNTLFALGDISINMNDDTGLPYIKRAWELLPGGSTVREPELLIVGNNPVFFLPRAGAGQAAHMVAYFEEYASYADAIIGGGHGFEQLFAAEAAYLAGDMDTARKRCQLAIQKSTASAQHDIVCNAHWLLARVCLYFGEYNGAKSNMDALAQVANTHPVAGLQDIRDCSACWFQLRAGDLARAAQWAERNRHPDMRDPYAIGRNRCVVAAYLLEKGETDQANAVLAQLEDILARRRKLWRVTTAAQLLRARLLLRTGDEEGAAGCFAQVCEVLYPDDLRLMVVELGAEAARLTEAVRRLQPGRLDEDWLAGLQAEAASYAKRQRAMGRLYWAQHPSGTPAAPHLTGREQEVLDYMAQGLTQEEMARLMGITVDGVKKHAGKIYTKLGALNRADAVHTATTNGLIGRK